MERPNHKICYFRDLIKTFIIYKGLFENPQVV